MNHCYRWDNQFDNLKLFTSKTDGPCRARDGYLSDMVCAKNVDIAFYRGVTIEQQEKGQIFDFLIQIFSRWVPFSKILKL